jgi:hypothetical protein
MDEGSIIGLLLLHKLTLWPLSLSSFVPSARSFPLIESGAPRLIVEERGRVNERGLFQ